MNIEWSTRARKDFGSLDTEVSRRIRVAIERLAKGEGDVRRLKEVDPPLYRLRVGEGGRRTPLRGPRAR